MNIAIIGAGAIGSVVAGYLAKAGEDVTLIGRPDHVKAIEQHGLRIKGARGEETFRVKSLTQLDRPYDLIIWSVKTQDIENAVSQNKKFLNSGLILSAQNGVRADKILSEFFPKERLISSIVMFGATYVKPGEATFNFEGDWILGNFFAPNNEGVSELTKILEKAFPIVISENIVGMKYLKLFVNFNNCIPALIGKSMQETFADLDLCRLSILLLKEGVDIVKKAGIELVSMPKFPVERIYGLTQMPLEQAAGIINKTLTTLSKEPLYGSILQSIMRGRPSEIDYINGEVVRLAKEKGLTAPLNEKIVELVHEVESTRQFFSKEKLKEQMGFILRAESRSAQNLSSR